jgi:thiamine kinase-like enzyme
MDESTDQTAIMPPEKDLVLEQRGDWLYVPADDPVAQHIATEIWGDPQPPGEWEVALLSSAVLIYRETTTGRSLIAKFYAAKSSQAEKYAEREFRLNGEAREAGLAAGDVRAVEPLGLWRGVLFLEYVEGLTLADVIAVRRSRPGTLLPALERSAELLARLHGGAPRPEEPVDFGEQVDYANKVIDTLTTYGVLQDDPLVRGGLLRLVDRWEANPTMRAYTPTLTHGDATTTNFVFPPGGGVVGIDWERAKVIDPAADLGRLMAEVAHSILQNGGTVAEATSMLAVVEEAYCAALDATPDTGPLAERARFYQAISTLRIARNGWLSRLARTALVTQAMAILA